MVAPAAVRDAAAIPVPPVAGDFLPVSFFACVACVVVVSALVVVSCGCFAVPDLHLQSEDNMQVQKQRLRLHNKDRNQP